MAAFLYRNQLFVLNRLEICNGLRKCKDTTKQTKKSCLFCCFPVSSLFGSSVLLQFWIKYIYGN